ncbi:MAG: hypothetical protein B6I20_08700 [Bacteroidetes bacterium 4572_117]|nr:MAG: hypothetical protein B6I20_08700 [Bacteroidetes bacterium 4572_117]
MMFFFPKKVCKFVNRSLYYYIIKEYFMFFFRINKLKIIDNKELPSFLGIFGPDIAQVKLVSFVTTDNMSLPDMSEFLKSNDKEVRKNILKASVAQVVDARILTMVENIKDNHIMYFGDTGYVLYNSETIPEHFNWQFVVYESDKAIRDTAMMVEDIINDDEFDTFTDNLSTLITGSTNPAYLASVAIGKFATKVILKVAGKNKDDMIGIIYMSLNRWEHYPFDNTI